MTRKLTLVDRKTGAVVEVDDAPGFVVPDGFALRTGGLMFMDSQPGGTVITDGCGNDPLAMYRPGFRMTSDSHAARGKAYADSVDAVANAYKPAQTLNPGSGKGSFGKIEAAAPVEGGVCTLQGGMPGKWKFEQTQGWVCIPDNAAELKKTAKQPGAADAANDPRRTAYLASVADAESAWRR